MTKKTLFMETTEVPAERTAAEISAEIIKAGATQIATDYKDGHITGLRWTMRIFGGDVAFSMPARVDPIYKILMDRKGIGLLWIKDSSGKLTDKPYVPDIYAKARRVAWRQLLRWVQAQLAMIETGMVRPEEVFFAYMFDPVKKQTVFQTFESTGGFKLLESGAKPQ
jgi:hypothetical protein